MEKYSLEELYDKLSGQIFTKERIQSIRKSKYKLTQIEFAKLIGVKFETYKNWEHGRRSPSSPGIAVLFLAEADPTMFIKNRLPILLGIKKMI